MKKHTGEIVKSTVFIVLLAVILIGTSYLFEPKGSSEKYGIDVFNSNKITAEPKNSIDVLVIGDSETYASISPMCMFEKYGFTSYVCGTSAQYISLSETFLKEALKSQKPKVVILETNAVYRKMSIKNSAIQKAESYFSVFVHHNRWKSIHSDDWKGFRYNTHIKGCKNKKYMRKSTAMAKIPSENEKYVLSMAHLCKAKGVDFVLLSTPSAKNWNYARHNGIAKLATANGIKYVDMNLLKKQVNIDWSRDTKDSGDHLNYYGAVKTSSFLGKYLSSNFILEDRRGDSRFADWQKSLARYKNIVGMAG